MGKKETFDLNKAWAFDLIGGKSLALRVNVISRRKALEAFKYSGSRVSSHVCEYWQSF